MASAEYQLRGYRHIQQMSMVERQKFLDSFDLVLCDCDGVIWQTLHDNIPGSAEAITYLRQKGKQVTFVTNNSISTIEDHMKKFLKCQIKVDKQDIIHPAQSVIDYLKSINFNDLIYCLATPPFKQMLRAAGLQLVNERDGTIIETLQDLHDAIYSPPAVKAIVIDVDFNLSAAKLMRAHVQLQADATCLFIGGAADPLIPFGGGDIIGPGVFIDIVAQATKRTPLILGKPGRGLCQLLQTRFAGIPAQRVLFIGDSLCSDVRFGRMCGYQTLLVLTGGTKSNDLEALSANDDDAKRPDYIADCLGQLHNIV